MRDRSTEQTAPIRYDLVTHPAGGTHPTLGQLLEMSDEKLANQDLALLNLRCAEGLPGTQKLDIDICLDTLHKWATWVKHETDRHLYKFRQTPADYKGSEGYFRMLMLITVLQQDFKVHYNPRRIRDVDFTKPQDLFIHGMIDNPNGGTCVSMPVLYTAVARRLDYPVRLVTAREHVFCRWDDGKDRFNIEATSQGMSSFDDKYYMSWPKPISENDVKRGRYLRSLSPAEELAVFLAARGHCFEDNGWIHESYVAYAHAARMAPRQPEYLGFLSVALAKEVKGEMIALRASDLHLRQLKHTNDYYQWRTTTRTPDVPTYSALFPSTRRGRINASAANGMSATTGSFWQSAPPNYENERIWGAVPGHAPFGAVGR